MSLARSANLAVFAWALLATPLGADSGFAAEYLPDRRKDQFPTNPAYLLVPFPYAVPGIALSGTLLNVAETNADVSAIYIAGGVKGEFLSAKELHLIPRTLFFDLEVFRLNSAVITNTRHAVWSRGVATSICLN